MATAAIKLRPVEVSPTTLQYAIRHKSPKERPNYKRRFYPNEDVQKTLSAPWLRFTDPLMPPYPYGKNHHFEEANHGLYGGKTIQSGNKISDGRNKGRTKRKWYPNVRVETHISEALGVKMDLPVVSRVSRTIRKVGGLDQYLLGEKPARLKELGLLGWKLRWLVAKSTVVQARWAQQRKELGLNAKDTTQETFAEAWKHPEVRQQLIEKMTIGWEQLREKDEKAKNHIRNVLNSRVMPARQHALFDPENILNIRNLVLPDEVEEGQRLMMPKIPQVQVNKQSRLAADTSMVANLETILENASKGVKDVASTEDVTSIEDIAAADTATHTEEIVEDTQDIASSSKEDKAV